LLLTAQRRDEVAEMPWSELDLENRIWHLPAPPIKKAKSRTKNSEAHDVHLSDLAMRIR
jgi:hypothetical protein